MTVLIIKDFFYINGKKTGEVSNSYKFKTDSDLFVGYGPSGEKEYAIGTIDDLKIYNCALTEDQIINLYTENNWDNKMQYIKGNLNEQSNVKMEK